MARTCTLLSGLSRIRVTCVEKYTTPELEGHGTAYRKASLWRCGSWLGGGECDWVCDGWSSGRLAALRQAGGTRHLTSCHEAYPAQPTAY